MATKSRSTRVLAPCASCVPPTPSPGRPAGVAAETDTADEVERATDELYSLDPDAFTAARNVRAKELTRGGAKEAAAAVKALPKPAVTAWALNQVARREAETVQALLDAGQQLREAQEQALAGDASGLRDATREQQGRIADVLDRASAVLRSGGREPNAGLVERLTATLRAASTDRAAGDLLRSGRLTADLSPAGFGLDDVVLTAAPPVRRTTGSKAKAAAKPTAEDKDRERREELKRLQREAKAAMAEADEAERQATAAEQEADE